MRSVELPCDERAHPEHALEWWYFVGHLRPIAVESHPGFTIGFVVLRAKVVLQGAIGLVLWVDHAKGVQPMRQSIQLLSRCYTDQGRNGFRFAFEDGGATWTLEASEDLHYSLRLAEHGRFVIDLDLRPGQAYALGDRGIVDYGRGVELAFYVRPHLAAEGRLRPDGGDPLDVAGSVWLERQWGDADPRSVRWKYLLIRVSDDEHWTFFRLEHRGGAAGVKRFACRMQGGALEQFAEDRFELEDFGRRSGIPVCTRIRMPSRGLDLVVEPLFDIDQRYRPALTPPFFEGASRVVGTIDGRPVDCWGMTEIANHEDER